MVMDDSPTVCPGFLKNSLLKMFLLAYVSWIQFFYVLSTTHDHSWSGCSNVAAMYPCPGVDPWAPGRRDHVFAIQVSIG